MNPVKLASNFQKRFSMAHHCFRFTFILFFIGLTSCLFANTPGKDFLITLNGSKLTGHIKDISLTNERSQISFENDFGDLYVIHPATIHGFAVEKNGEVTVYESKYLEGQWLFLKVENKGDVISLYTSTERQVKFTDSNDSPLVEGGKTIQFWLQFDKEEPFKVYRFNYKRVLKEHMSAYPEIIEQLGKRGFKYRNLPAIVELFNKLYNMGNKSS